MKIQLRNWLCEIIILSIYKYIFEFIYLQRYMKIFSYAYSNYTYRFEPNKWLISIILFSLFGFVLLFTRRSDNPMYSYLIRFVYTICIIPMLAVYAFFDGINTSIILYPVVFMSFFIYMLKRYASKNIQNEKQIFRMPRIPHINTVLLITCAIIAIGIWFMSGRPVFFDLSYALEQRLQLRVNAMPRIIGYLFVFLGGTIFPYLFAKYIDEKKYLYSVACFACGILLFFVNGMKTWLFLYLFFFGILFIIRIGKEIPNRTYIMFDSMMLLLIVFSVFVYDHFNVSDIISQVARVTVVPNDIGFTFVDFFKKSGNPYLFLRESVFRNLFESPYVGGSDFFVSYGTSASVSSARANNGLWGDAYRNFGIIGIIIYPFMIAKMYNIVEENSRHMKSSLRLFALFMLLWGSINNSFFTWLLTGGVFVIIILEKIDRSNMDFNEGKDVVEKRKRIVFGHNHSL